MGNKRNRRSRRADSQSQDRQDSIFEGDEQGNQNLDDFQNNSENVFPNRNLEVETTETNRNLAQLREPSETSNEIQVWTERMSQENRSQINEIRQEMNSKFEMLLQEIKENRSVSAITNPRSEVDENPPQNPTSSRNIMSEVENASNKKTRAEMQDTPFRSSEMLELRQPVEPTNLHESGLDDTLIINEGPRGAEYHMVTGANQPLLRQISQNSQASHDPGSHAAHFIPEPNEQINDPVNQIAVAIERLASRAPQQSLFHPKNTLTFNGKFEKNEKFEYFEDLFHTTLRMQPNLTEEMKINHFHAHLRGLALKTFKNIQRTTNPTLEDRLVVFRRKYVKPESSASAKHRFHKLMFEPENQKLADFLEDLQESAEKAFGDQATNMIESLLYAKIQPHLKKSINQAYLENGTYEQIVKHLEREMELNGLESDEPLVNTQMSVTKQTTSTPKQQKTQNQNVKPKNANKTPKTVPNNTLQDNQCRYCKDIGHLADDCPKLAKRLKLDEDPSAPRCNHCNTPGHEEDKCYFGANMENRPPKWTLTDTQKKLVEQYKASKKPCNSKASKPQIWTNLATPSTKCHLKKWRNEN